MANVIMDSPYTGETFGNMLVLNRHKTGTYYVRVDFGGTYGIARATEEQLLSHVVPDKIFRKLVGNPYIRFDNGTTVLFDIKGETFTIDTVDLPKTLSITWNVHHDVRRLNTKDSKYVIGGYTDPDTKKWVSLSFARYLLDVTDDEIQIDHKNLDTTDNTRKNLRISTQTENMRNRSLFVNNEAGVRGVRLDKRSNTYQARITVNGTQIYLGESKDIKEAERLRLEAEKKYFGQFSNAD